MEIPFYEDNWQGIPFKNIEAANLYGNRVADKCFYDSFYKNVFDSKKEMDRDWLAGKKAVSDWVEDNFLQPLCKGSKDGFRILSLGCGMAVVEEPWIKKGYQVTLQEKSEVPLQNIKRLYPEIPVYVCDARKVPLGDKAYDFVFFSGVDYLFNSADYTTLLREVHRLLKDDGTVLCICFSNASARNVSIFFLKKAIKFIRREKYRKGRVLWGYARTAAGHIDCGRKAGLIADKIYIFKRGFSGLLKTRTKGLFWRRPVLGNFDIAINWRKDK